MPQAVPANRLMGQGDTATPTARPDAGQVLQAPRTQGDAGGRPSAAEQAHLGHEKPLYAHHPSVHSLPHYQVDSSAINVKLFTLSQRTD
jgi:hypothetical protein